LILDDVLTLRYKLNMKKIRWDPEKSQQILDNPDRGISLELIAELVQAGFVLGIEQRRQYPDQKAFVVLVDQDVWCVPFREDEDTIFLITAWPDRQLKRKYQ
jgi:hypothetical protein